MITRNRMRFLKPEGGEGGGTAVLDAPAKVDEPAMTPVGDVYRAALAKEQGKEPAAASGPTGATGPAATGPASTGPAASGATSASGATGATGPAKPASALDAAIEPAADEKKPDATGAEDLLKDLPETLPTQGRGEHWAKARGAIEKQGKTIVQLTKTIGELTQQVEAAKAIPPESTGRIAELEKQLDEYKDAMVAVNVELHPDFRKEFVDGRKALVSKAAAKLNAFGGKGDLLTEALGMPEGRGRTQAIKEALGELEEVERNRVLQFVGEVEKLDDKRSEIQSDPQGAWAKLQESENKRKSEANSKAEEFKKSVFEKVAVELPKTVFLLREVDPSLGGAEEHNTNARAMREAAFKLLGKDAKPEELVEAAFWKQAGPKLQDLFVADRKELKDLRARLAEYEAAEPGFRGGKPPKETPKEEQLKKSPEQIYNEVIEAGGQG